MTVRLRPTATRTGEWTLPTALIAAGLALWEAFVRLSGTPAWFLPAPSAVVAALARNWRLIAHHTWVTTQEVL
ncbi:MAG: ABC transporter permease, partial [Thermomicrobiaceae bacterium]|nr:ABC transporter permease [Thermomicrobiaceae bacterium]